MSAVEQLCPNCGLCCDSTLFADVELQKRDDVKLLAKLGLALEKKGRSKLAFAQPCACFDGKLCQIYHDRPQRCRKFDCGLLKCVDDETMTAAAALQKIADTKKRAETIRGLLRSLGQRDERMPLTQRYAEAISAPVDFSNEAQAEAHGELMLAVNDLMDRLQKDFLQ